MNKHFRTVYIVRWECDAADYWHIVGAYTMQDEALFAVKVFQERNPDGLTYVETVILPAR